MWEAARWAGGMAGWCCGGAVCVALLAAAARRSRRALLLLCVSVHTPCTTITIVKLTWMWETAWMASVLVVTNN